MKHHVVFRVTCVAAFLATCMAIFVTMNARELHEKDTEQSPSEQTMEAPEHYPYNLSSDEYLPFEPIDFEADSLRNEALLRIERGPATPAMLHAAPEKICDILNVEFGNEAVLPEWWNKALEKEDYDSISGWDINSGDGLKFSSIPEACATAHKIEFTSPQNSTMTVEITFLPSERDTRLRWLHGDIKAIGGSLGISTRHFGYRRIVNGPGDYCLLPSSWSYMHVREKRTESPRFRWDESQMIFFRKSCLVRISRPRPKLPEGSDVHALRTYKGGFIDFANQIDALLIKFFADEG
jgi:hypothetical protein